MTGTGAVLPKCGAVSGSIDEDVHLSFVEANATPMHIQAPAAQPVAVAVADTPLAN